MPTAEIRSSSGVSSRVSSPNEAARRQTVVAVTLVVGATLLGVTFHLRADSPGFYTCAFAVAAVWVAGALLSGPIPVRSTGATLSGGRGIITAAVIGAGLYAFFVAVDLGAREIPVVNDALVRILAHADRGPVLVILLVAAVNAVGEEAFFRGALYSAFTGRRAAEWSWLVYLVVTAVTTNLALVAAAAILGLVTVCERRAAGGVGVPIVTHAAWSALMITALPR